MIRQLQESDIGAILSRASDFWAEIEGKSLLGELHLAGFSNFLRSGFRKEELIGWTYTKEEEILSAILFRYEYSFFTNKINLSEIFWWAHPSVRNSPISYKLILEAERFAAKNNIDGVQMACMEHPRPERLAKFYERIGYKKIQYNFLKQV